jgi:hypothetical protein
MSVDKAYELAIKLPAIISTLQKLFDAMNDILFDEVCIEEDADTYCSETSLRAVINTMQ